MAQNNSFNPIKTFITIIVIAGLFIFSSFLISCINTPEIKEINYIGLSVKEANQLAMENATRFRVIEIDGNRLAVTMDYVPGRINVSIADGKVVGISIEGQ